MFPVPKDMPKISSVSTLYSSIKIRLVLRNCTFEKKNFVDVTFHLRITLQILNAYLYLYPKDISGTSVIRFPSERRL